MKYFITEEQKKEIEEVRKKNQNKRVEKRLRVLMLKAEGFTISKIAETVGYSLSHVSQLITLYCREGIKPFIENHYKGNRRNMSFEEEEEFLEQFRKRAEVGMLVEVREIEAAYRERVGHSIGGSQIYYLLERHEWRKIKPRSKHPNKATTEEIESSKKLTLESLS